MRVKDMFLRNEQLISNFFLIIFFLFSSNVYSITNDKTEVLNYLNSLKNFSANFLQNDGDSLSEGKVYIGTKRVRVEYLSPTKILVILGEEKAMFYNYELEEDEFFDPKNTNAWFFYDIFRNPLFLENSIMNVKNKEIIIEKKGFDNDEKDFLIKVYFEQNPLVLRGVEVTVNDETLKLSIYNHNYYQEFDENFFKLINPKLLN